MKEGHVLVVVVILATIGMLMAGCATYETYALDPVTKEMVLVGKGNAGGFLRDYVVTKTYDKDTGKLIQETIASTSTAATVMSALNEIGGTLIDAAGKAKP